MSLARLKLQLRKWTRRMRFRASIYALFGIATALLGTLAAPLIPERVAGIVGADSVGNLLTILASSMLAVTTFSLSIMVAAYASASNGATPRATRLLIADSAAQNALATFIGAFLFSVVGLIALSTGMYGDSGRVVLFAATVAVIAVITLTLLRWIDQLSSFGRVGTTIRLVERVTREAMEAHLRDPWLGGAPGAEAAPAGATPILAGEVAYVEHVDTAQLSALAGEAGGTVHLALRPGALTSPAAPLAWFEGAPPGQDLVDAIRASFTLSGERSFEQDPRYGFVVLTEIGSRALSAAVNDPGTAIDVIVTLSRLLCDWAASAPATPAPRHARVFVPPVEPDDLFEDIFPPLARDGAHVTEIGIHLQKALAAIAGCGSAAFNRSASHQAGQALARGLAALQFDADRDALRNAMLRAAPPAR